MSSRSSSRRFRSAQLLFGLLFLVSICALYFSVTSLGGRDTSALPPKTPAPAAAATSIVQGTSPAVPTPATTPVTATDNSLLTVVLPLVTSLLSFLGFISTTFFSWRKDRHDARLAAIQLQRAELELEKSRLELEKLRGNKVGQDEEKHPGLAGD